MESIQAVIFDMDGLMLDTERLTMEAWDWAGEKLGVGPLGYMTVRDLGVTRERSAELFDEEFGGRLTRDTVAGKAREYFAEYLKENGVPVKPGVSGLLRCLKDGGYRLAVATNTVEENARAELTQAGLLPFFDRLVFGSMVKRGKPAPDIFLMAAEMLGVHPSGCMVLDDSPNGIRAAYAAGMKPVVIPDLVEPDGEILKMAVRRLNSLDEVLGLLEELG